MNELLPGTSMTKQDASFNRSNGQKVGSPSPCREAQALPRLANTINQAWVHRPNTYEAQAVTAEPINVVCDVSPADLAIAALLGYTQTGQGDIYKHSLPHFIASSFSFTDETSSCDRDRLFHSARSPKVR